MPMSDTRQRNAVSEGFALGLLLNGRRSITFNKLAVDLAARRAFLDWPHRDTFPKVISDLRRNFDGFTVLTRAGETTDTSVFYWDKTGKELTIVNRDSTWAQDAPSDVAVALDVIGGDLTQDAWESLGSAFLLHFTR